MSLHFVLRLNALVCIICGVICLAEGDAVNAYFGNQHPQVMLPAGLFMLVYGIWLGMVTRQAQIKIKQLTKVICADYGWTLAVFLLISTGQVFTTPMGIRVAMVTALFTAVTGALEFRHYKLMAGKF